MQLILVDDFWRVHFKLGMKIVAYQKNFKKNWVYGLACHF